MNFSHRRPVHRRALQPRPAQRRRQGRGVPQVHRHRRHRLLRRPRPSSTSSTTCASRPSRTPATTTSTPSRAPGTPGRVEEGGNRGYKTPLQGRLLPGPAGRPLRRPARPDVARARPTPASRSSAPTTRSAPPARPRSTTSSTRCATSADKVMLFKYIVKNVGVGGRQDGRPSCRSRSSATTARACTATSRCGRTATPLFYDELGYGGLSDMARWYIGGLLHHAPSLLAFTNPTVNSYHRLVPGFEAPVNLVYSAAQPLGLHPHPDHRLQPEGQAHRVPRAGPVVQPVPRVLGDADGRPRRHQEQDRAARRRSTRTSTSCRRTRHAAIAQVPGSLDEVLDALEADHDVPHRGRRVHRGPDRDLDRLQAHQRDRPDPAAPAPARVRALLRHLSSVGRAAPSGALTPRARTLGRSPECPPDLRKAADISGFCRLERHGFAFGHTLLGKTVRG